MADATQEEYNAQFAPRGPNMTTMRVPTTPMEDALLEARAQAHKQVASDPIRHQMWGSELQDWWMESARSEIEPLIHKIIEYGGNGRAQDLVDIGRRMFDAGVKLPGQTRPFEDFHVDEAEDSQFIELTIYFYIIGKIGRWTAAINEGRPVSDDTLHDIIIYTKMLQRVRDKGGWPV